MTTSCVSPVLSTTTVWALWVSPDSGDIYEQEHDHEGRTNARALALTAERINRLFGDEVTIVALLVSPTAEAKAEALRVATSMR